MTATSHRPAAQAGFGWLNGRQGVRIVVEKRVVFVYKRDLHRFGGLLLGRSWKLLREGKDKP
jgi:hypothetical protein